MENFIRRCTQYAAKLDNDMSISLLNQQQQHQHQFHNVANAQQQQPQQQQQQQQTTPYDNHFQIVSADGHSKQQQLQNEQYLYKTCNYYHHHHCHYDSDLKVMGQSNNNSNNSMHQMTDKNNNNFAYTRTTTAAAATTTTQVTACYHAEQPLIYDYEWLANDDDDDDYNDGDDDSADNNNRGDGNDDDNADNIYVAIKNDELPITKPNNNKKNINEYLRILLPALKAFGFSSTSHRIQNIESQHVNDNNCNKNNNCNHNANGIENKAKTNNSDNNDDINTTTTCTTRPNKQQNILVSKRKKKAHKNKNISNNNMIIKQRATTAAKTITTKNHKLVECRKKVLQACNKTLTNLITTTISIPKSTTTSPTITATKKSSAIAFNNCSKLRKQQQQQSFSVKNVNHHNHHHHYRHQRQHHSQQHKHHHNNNNKQHRQQQQFRLLPSLGTTSFLTLLTLISLETLLLTTVTDCAKTFYMHWNTSNSIFRIDNTDHIIDVNKGNLAFEFDQVHIICPVYEPGTYENETEKYIIYNVSKVEYETCRITNADPRVIAICDKPQKLMFFTITFRPFTPQPGGLEFLPGNDYYFISTSSKDDLYRRIGGRCSTNNMKVVFKVCCAPEDKNKTNASAIGGIGTGGGGGNNVIGTAGNGNIATATGIVTTDTGTIHMDNGGGGHQAHGGGGTTTQQLNKNMQVIGVNTAIMPIGGSGGGTAGTNPPMKTMKNGGIGGGTSINTNIDQFNRIPLQQQTHGINIIGNNMATSMGQLPHGIGGHTHGGHTGLDGGINHNNGINSAINVVVSNNNGNGNIGGGGIGGGAGSNGIMLTPNHGILPANGIGISGYSNIGHTNSEIGMGSGIRINNVPTQQYHPPYKQGNNNKLNTNGDEHHFNKHPNEVVKNEELTYNSAAYSLHHHESTAIRIVTFVWKFIWKLCKSTCHGFIHVYHKFNSQIEIQTIPTTIKTAKTSAIKLTKPTSEHLIAHNLNAFNCILTKHFKRINFNHTTTTKFQNSIVNLSVMMMEGFFVRLNQTHLDVKYLFKRFHPILFLIISILIVMTAYYQLNSISFNHMHNILITSTQRTTKRCYVAANKTSKRKDKCHYHLHYKNSNEYRALNAARRHNDFIER